MIYVKDLMIGDWVCTEHDSTPRQIDWIRTGEVGLFWDKVVTPPYLVPIPITPKILEKNGFHWGCTASEEDFCAAVGCGYPDSGWCFDEGAGEIKIIFPNETDGGLVRLDDQNGDRYLELIFVEPLMVHELQNALRLCGIEKDLKL